LWWRILLVLPENEALPANLLKVVDAELLEG
jgi:hypothetical protein